MRGLIDGARSVEMMMEIGEEKGKWRGCYVRDQME